MKKKSKSITRTRRLCTTWSLPPLETPSVTLLSVPYSARAPWLPRCPSHGTRPLLRAFALLFPTLGMQVLQFFARPLPSFYPNVTSSERPALTCYVTVPLCSLSPAWSSAVPSSKTFVTVRNDHFIRLFASHLSSELGCELHESGSSPLSSRGFSLNPQGYSAWHSVPFCS